MKMIHNLMVVLTLLGCSAASASEPVCKPNLFSLTSSRSCSEPGLTSGKSLHAMYSRNEEAIQFDSQIPGGMNLETTELASENLQLSNFGPDAAATFKLACARKTGLSVKLDFPGYPFAEDNDIPINIQFGNNRNLSLAARVGQNFNEVQISAGPQLQRFWSIVRAYRNSEASVGLKDSDGTAVSAKFIFAKIFDEMEEVVKVCS